MWKITGQIIALKGIKQLREVFLSTENEVQLLPSCLGNERHIKTKSLLRDDDNLKKKMLQDSAKIFQCVISTVTVA